MREGSELSNGSASFAEEAVKKRGTLGWEGEKKSSRLIKKVYTDLDKGEVHGANIPSRRNVF